MSELTSYFMDLSIGKIIPLNFDANGAGEPFYENVSFVLPPESESILDSPETSKLFTHSADSPDILLELSAEHAPADLHSPGNGRILWEESSFGPISFAPESEEFWLEQWSDSQDFLLELLTDDAPADVQPPNVTENMLSSIEMSCQPMPGNAEILCEQSAESAIGTDNGTSDSFICLSNVTTKSDGKQLCQGKQVSDRPNIHTYITAGAKPIIKGSCDNTVMFVRSTIDKAVKKLCCPFCSKLFVKLARHMAAMHKKEPDVKRFLNLPTGSKERRMIQDALRKTGLLMWNTNSDLNKNEFIPCRRPNPDLKKDGTGYITCPYCFGGYTTTNLRHHVADCYQNPVKNDRSLLTLARAAEGRVHENASVRLAQVISVMHEDHIVRLIRYDWLLIVFGNKMVCKYTPHYQENMIRARLRLSGRVLYEIKKIDANVTNFASIYHVEQYNSLVAAIKIIGRFDPNTNEFGAPAMASCAVTFIKHIGKYLSAEYIRLRDRENKMETEDFLTYMDTDIGISILKLVAETQSRMRREKVQNIPTMDDVKKLIRYINKERNACFEVLSEKYTYENWTKLAELCMAWMVVFNRRRTGETQNILVREYLGRNSVDDESNEQMLSKLSEDAKVVARKFKRMKIRGKKGRTVPVLLKPSVDKAVQLLMTHREQTGIASGSPFLFQLPSSQANRVKTVDACQTLRKLSLLCGATNPSSLRGTNLRKHMATTCVSLELNDALVSEVADFMGHAEKIHREYYRQNTIEREVVQMAELLEAAAGKCDSGDEDDDEDGIDQDRYFLPEAVVTVSKENINEPMVAENNDFVVTVSTENIDEAMVLEDDDKLMDDLQMSLPQKFKDGSVVAGDCLKPKFTKKRWSQDEIKCVRKVFAIHFKSRTLPTPLEISNQQKKHAELRGRTWQQIKTWINNQQKKL